MIHRRSLFLFTGPLFVSSAVLIGMAVTLCAKPASGQPETPDSVTPEASEEVTPPELLRYVEARLPEGYLLQEATSVKLEVSIRQDGSVESARALEPDAPDELVQAAQTAALEFLFRPALRGEEAVPVLIEYTYWFAANPPPEDLPSTPTETTPEATTPPETPAIQDGKATAPESAPHDAATETDDEVYEAVAEVETPPREPTRRDIPREQLWKMPGSRGDPIRAIEVLPGVSRAPMGNNPIIRGAGGHESAFFLDGMPIPELYHFGGLTSVIHPALLESVHLYPGNFSARYGRATGGVIEAKLRSPKTDALHGILDVNLIDSSLLVEGPLTEGLSAAAAVRRSNIDFVFETFVPEDAFNVIAAPVYWDYQVITEYQPQPGARLRLLANGSRDTLKLLFSEPNAEDPALRGEVSGGLEHHTAMLTYDLRSPTFVQSYQVAIGTDRLRQQLGADQAEFNGLRLASRAEWSATISDSFQWISGLDFAGFSLREGGFRGAPPGAQEGALEGPYGAAGTVATEGDPKFWQLSPALYTEARWFPTSRWLVVPGIRADYYEDLDALTLNPRLSQRYSLTDEWTFKSGIGGYSQRPIWWESVTSIGNPEIGPYHALHASLGVERSFGSVLKLDTEAFYKSLYDRVVATQGGAPPYFENDGQGRIYGVEAGARFTPSNATFGQLSYTLSRSERQERDEPYRLFDFDQTHVLNAAFATALGYGFELGARFRWINGNPTTPIVGAVYDATNGYYRPRYGAHNSDRDPAFHQLDVRLDKHFQIGSGRLTAYLEVLNAYNAENAEGYSYSYDYSQQSRVTSQPFFPNLGLRGEL